jgi:F-type H+-transporting ATPase subunit b
MSMLSTPEFWVLVAFVLFVAIFGRKVAAAVGAALDARAAKIRAQIAEGEALRAEAQKLLSEYAAKRAAADQEAAEIVAAAKVDAQRIRAKAETDLAASVALREKQAVDRIAQAEASALAEVRSVAADVAIAAARGLLKDKLAGAPAQALIDQSIDQLPRKLH